MYGRGRGFCEAGAGAEADVAAAEDPVNMDVMDDQMPVNTEEEEVADSLPSSLS
jgi:hypothetical protein